MSGLRFVLPLLALCLLAAACGGGEDSGSGPPDPLRDGRSLYADTCSVCHGDRGQGGVGPSLETVLQTWPECDAQAEWISLGSEGWRSAHGDSYGAPGRPVKGGMPPQGDQMTEREIRLVAAFERVEYGGQDREAALADCAVE